jgi:hypothetical protein
MSFFHWESRTDVYEACLKDDEINCGNYLKDERPIGVLVFHIEYVKNCPISAQLNSSTELWPSVELHLQRSCE